MQRAVCGNAARTVPPRGGGGDPFVYSIVLHSWLYEHGTHFAFPESMFRMMLPVGSGLLVSFMFRAGKEHKKECRKTRIDIDRRLKKALAEW